MDGGSTDIGPWAVEQFAGATAMSTAWASISLRHNWLDIVLELSSWPVFNFGLSNIPLLILAFSRLYNFAYRF